MTISAVIPTWNRRDLLEAALASLAAQARRVDEVVVVDNGSTDGSADAARRAGAQVLQLSRNWGFSAAVNRGLDATRGEAVVVMNNDVELAPDWTGKLAAALEAGSAWFAIGKLLDHAARDRVDGAGDAICRGGTACRLGHGRPDGPWFERPRPVFFPSATAVLLRREFFSRTGPLEEAFFAYLEDVDLGLRAALLGMEGLYVPEAVAYHRGSATLGAWNSRVVEWMTRNQILLLAKYYPASALWREWRAVLVAQVLWAALAWRRGRPLAWARGFAAGLARARGLRRAAVRWRSDGRRLAEVLADSEQELLSFEQSTGWDYYWRWYFRLAPRARETQL